MRWEPPGGKPARFAPPAAVALTCSNDAVAEDIEERLTAAAEALREHEVTVQRQLDLRARADIARGQLETLQASLRSEEADVEQLEHMSLTRILASLRGNRDDAISRERAEADAVRYRVAESESLLDVLNTEIATAQSRLDRLADAPRTYAAVLMEKESYLSATGDPRGRRLLEIATERGTVAAEQREVTEALTAAAAALSALAAVKERLDSASGWSTYDTFFGGGAISSSIKHQRMDEAAQAAAFADHRLAILRTELADVQGLGVTAPQLAMTSMTRFVDVWFDNIFTDLAVRDRIQTAQRNVQHALNIVQQVQLKLARRAEAAKSRTATLQSERARILTSSGQARLMDRL